MNLEKRIDLLAELGEYCLSQAPALEAAKYKAYTENGWFIPEFIDLAIQQIATQYLQKDKLTAWVKKYNLLPTVSVPKTIGLIMAGNIPLVGFHDLLTIFISGHRQLIKTSTRDNTLIHHLVEWMITKDPEVAGYIAFAERLNGCDAYIATGSNNSGRYFDYYFGKYPHIIRRNRTSVALLAGNETPAELSALADDVNLYFGLGCRNVTQIYVPENYDFLPLLNAFNKYQHLSDLQKYKNNYDYQLTLLLLNKKFYMTNGHNGVNGTILLTENESPFSPISVLHYQYYKPGQIPPALTENNTAIQCIVGQTDAAVQKTSSTAQKTSSAAEQTGSPAKQTGSPAKQTASAAEQTGFPAGQTIIPFGNAQQPSLDDYADGVDTLQFLRDL
ncbi:MAG TPA: hypothetical protein VL727_04390 [Puia sp.]|nr:hypothetical protein [Puia sp.]